MVKRLLKLSAGFLILILLSLVGFHSAAVLRETNTSNTIEHNGRRIETRLGAINVISNGDSGPHVLLVHGVGAWGGFWQETADVLAQAGFQAHAMDLPPFGFSERAPWGDYSHQAQAARILALVETMPEKPILIAHGYGAAIGVEAALQHPDAFAGVVIVSGVLFVGQKAGDTSPLKWPLSNPKLREFAVSITLTNPLATRFLLRKMLHNKDQLTEDHVDTLRLPMTLQGTTQALSQWVPNLLVPPQNALSTDRAAYRKFPLQTALIWGDEDSIAPLLQGAEIHALLPNSTLTIMPDVGHIPQIEDPHSFQSNLLQALARISNGAE